MISSERLFISCAATGRRRVGMRGMWPILQTYPHNDLQHSRSPYSVGEVAIWPVNKVASHTFFNEFVCLVFMVLSKCAKHSLDASLACVHRPERGKWCT